MMTNWMTDMFYRRHIQLQYAAWSSQDRCSFIAVTAVSQSHQSHNCEQHLSGDKKRTFCSITEHHVRCCGIFASLVPLYKTLDLLT